MSQEQLFARHSRGVRRLFPIAARALASRYLPFLRQHVPIFAWLPNYRRENLASDVIAGIVVTMVLVPTAMAYAQLAGLPVQAGLYGSILPVMLYAAFSRSPVLSVAPVTIVSLMVGSILAPLGQAGSAETIGCALILAFLSGCILLALGALRLGTIANFVSHPVLNGFVSAAGVVMVCGQLKSLLGLSLPSTTIAPYVVVQALSHLHNVRFATWLIAGGAVGLLVYRVRVTRLLMQRGAIGPTLAAYLPKAMPLVVVGLGVLLCRLFDLEKSSGVLVVGSIPSGLPPISLPPLDGAAWRILLPGALLISLVGFIESMAVAKVLARKRGERVDFDQELIAMGTANLGAAFTSGYPVSAGLFRSAINIEAGAVTPLASIVTAIGMLLTVLVLGPVLYYLPQSVLAAIVITASFGLIKFKPFFQAWRCDRLDGFAFIATFVGVLAFGIEAGLLAGIALSIGTYLWRSSRPLVSVIEKPADSGTFTSSNAAYPSIVSIAIGDSLYFGNAEFVERQVQGLLAKATGTHTCVLVFSSVNSLDSSAIDVLSNLHRDLEAKGVTLRLAEVKPPLRPLLAKAGLAALVDP